MKLTPEQLTAVLQQPEWEDIGNLPSNFYPYPTFKQLYIRPFTTKHLRLLSKATVTRDIRNQIRAVDLVITQDVNELSVGDYYYILEWLKIYSTTKTPVIVDWHCPEQRLKHKETGEYISNKPDVLKATAATINPDDYILEPCGTHNTESLHMTNLEIIQLPEEGWTPLPEGFDFPRVANLPEVREALLDPELNMLVGPAQWVAGATLEEKLRILDEQPNLDMFTEAQALNDTVVHGLKETSTLHCRTCQAEHPYTINIDALDFFR